LAAILDHDQLAFEHVDEFVLVRMPVALARPVAGGQAHEIDPEVGEPAGVAQALAHALGTGRVEGRRIARAFAFRHGGDVDPGHGSPPSDQRPSLCAASAKPSYHNSRGEDMSVIATRSNPRFDRLAMTSS